MGKLQGCAKDYAGPLTMAVASLVMLHNITLAFFVYYCVWDDADKEARVLLFFFFLLFESSPLDAPLAAARAFAHLTPDVPVPFRSSHHR